MGRETCRLNEYSGASMRIAAASVLYDHLTTADERLPCDQILYDSMHAMQWGRSKSQEKKTNE